MIGMLKFCRRRASTAAPPPRVRIILDPRDDGLLYLISPTPSPPGAAWIFKLFSKLNFLQCTFFISLGLLLLYVLKVNSQCRKWRNK